VRFEVRNGSFRYPKSERQVLQNVSFAAEAGEVTAILGPNGAGKTTLLRCAMGLLKWNGGGSYLDGKDIRRLSYRELWQKVAYVPQARQASDAYTVEEMVLLGRSARIGRFSLPGKEDLAAAAAALERLGLSRYAARRCSELSGGELQMVLIARALASQPEVLILDEPESNLDFKNQLLVLDTMTSLAAEGMTCIFNTHYPAHALRRAQKAFLLSKSGEFRFGPTHTVLTEEAIASFFGVRAVIGEIETDGRIYEDVFPVELHTGELPAEPKDGTRVIAGITILAPDRSEAEDIQRILHGYAEYIVGRMGMPYRSGNVNIIHLTLDAPAETVRELTGRLNLLPELSVKAVYAKEL